jgi:doubled CXXCH motif protein
VRRAPPGSIRLAVFLLFAGALAALLIGYTLRHRRPLIPADLDHVRSVEPARCLDCHGPAGKNPRGRNHPLNDQCFNCHERA